MKKNVFLKLSLIFSLTVFISCEPEFNPQGVWDYSLSEDLILNTTFQNLNGNNPDVSNITHISELLGEITIKPMKLYVLYNMNTRQLVFRNETNTNSERYTLDENHSATIIQGQLVEKVQANCELTYTIFSDVKFEEDSQTFSMRQRLHYEYRTLNSAVYYDSCTYIFDASTYYVNLYGPEGVLNPIFMIFYRNYNFTMENMRDLKSLELVMSFDGIRKVDMTHINNNNEPLFEAQITAANYLRIFDIDLLELQNHIDQLDMKTIIRSDFLESLEDL